MTMGRDNVEGKFVREDCKLRLAGAGGNLVAVTATGDVLETRWNVARAYENWLKLPDEKRRAGAVKVPTLGPDDAPLTVAGGRLARQPDPPEDALIVKLFLRALSRDSDGLRHMRREDVPGDHHMTKKRNYYDANPDYLWLKRDEWQTLVPKDPRSGQTFPVAGVVTERIFRFHLNPTLVFGETNGLRKEDIRDGKLTLTVESLSDNTIRMRMEGFARLGSDFATAEAAAKEKRASSGYEPQLLGALEFDRRKGRFTKFDLVALGDTYGQLGGDLKYLYRPGRNPLGVAFELVPPNGPIADRTVPPRGMRFPRNYYSTGD
jgi:hypothetical protein